MDVKVEGFFGLLILIADIWAILNIVQSPASTGKKLLWILIILLLPVVGVLIWWFIGPRESRG
jgi:hypothetical protein